MRGLIELAVIFGLVIGGAVIELVALHRHSRRDERAKAVEAAKQAGPARIPEDPAA